MMDTMSSDKHQSFSLSSIHSVTRKQGCEIWGGELSASRRTCRFVFADNSMIHLLSLWTICLGGAANEEMHVIAVENEETRGQPVVIASLQPSALPMVNVNGIEFIPPGAFILLSGSGPVYISGQHVLVDDNLEYEAQDNEENRSF